MFRYCSLHVLKPLRGSGRLQARSAHRIIHSSPCLLLIRVPARLLIHSQHKFYLHQIFSRPPLLLAPKFYAALHCLFPHALSTFSPHFQSHDVHETLCIPGSYHQQSLPGIPSPYALQSCQYRLILSPGQFGVTFLPEFVPDRDAAYFPFPPHHGHQRCVFFS